MKSTPLSLTAFATLVAGQEAYQYGQPQPPKYGATTTSSVPAPPYYGGSPSSSSSSSPVAPPYYGGSSSSSSSPVAPPYYGGSTSSSIVSTTSAPVPPYYGGKSSSSSSSSSSPVAPPYYGGSSSSSSVVTTSSPVAPPYYGGSSSSNSATYACNPAHDYGNGASCISTSGTLSLYYPTTTSKSAYATPSSACPAPGTYDSQGRYSCNPAHQYPEGQICDYVDGCPYLRQPGPGVSVNVTAPAYPSQTYACNPAHDYGNGASCISTSGTLSLVYPTATATPTGYGNEKVCYAKYNECRTSPDANFSYCASQYAGCLGYNPFANNGTNTVTPKYSQPPVYTTDVVTSLTTVCPSPTTFTHEQKTYTITSATTLTLPCKSGCTVTKPYGPPKTETTVVTSLTTVCPQPTTFTHEQKTYTVTSATTLTLPCKGGCTITKTKPVEYPTKPVYSVPTYAPSFYPNTTIHIPVPPKTETTVVTELTTYCPTSTIITHKQSTYTVTTPTTLTLPCPGGCTITKPVEGPKTTVPVVVPSQPPKAPTYEQPKPQPSQSSAVVPPPVYTPQQPGTTLKSTPVAPTYPAGTPPVAPTYPAGTTPAPSAPSATRPATYPSSSVVQYTGAAAQVMATGLPMAAAAVAAMLF